MAPKTKQHELSKKFSKEPVAAARVASPLPKAPTFSAEPTLCWTVFEFLFGAFKTFFLSLLLAGVAGFAVYTWKTGTTDLFYRWMTTIKAFFAVVSLKQADVQAFIESYEIFEEEKITPEMESKIVDYYNVINHLCALGEVEKMYIPPYVDESKGCYGNQLAFEIQMVKALGVQKGQKVLELGCGRGRIVHHVARLTGASVTGLNIDKGQVAEARFYARITGMEDQLDFVIKSFNDYPLPFDDSSFHAMYHVQAFTYVSDLEKMFSELWRVLKPGARISFLDWFVLDNYDESNAKHRELLRKTKALIGAVYTPHPKVYESLLKKQGFTIIKSGEASAVGSAQQFPLIEAARDFFMPVGTAVNFLCRWGIVPQNTATLLNRLNLYVDDFIESDRLRLFTTSWQIVAEKPKAA